MVWGALLGAGLGLLGSRSQARAAQQAAETSANAQLEAAGGNSDSTESISGSITPAATSISNIPARTLTGNYWQITATYFV